MPSLSVLKEGNIHKAIQIFRIIWGQFTSGLPDTFIQDCDIDAKNPPQNLSYLYEEWFKFH